MKFEEEDIISHFLKTDIISICLELMQNGNDINKILGTFITSKLLSSNETLTQIC